MSRYYRVPRTNLIIDLDRVILVSADDSRTSPPYTIRLCMTGPTVVNSQLTYGTLEDFARGFDDLESALVRRSSSPSPTQYGGA